MKATLPLSIPDTDWKPNTGLDDPLSSLIGPTIIINGLSMHTEAWEVTDEDDEQRPHEAWEQEYVDLHAAVHADGKFQTLKIGDRHYVVVISPHCE